MAARSLDIHCFSPGNRPCSLAPFRRLLAKSQSVARASRFAVCLSSTVLRLQEHLDSACRPFLRIDDDDSEEEYKVNEDYDGISNGSSNKYADKYATSSNGSIIGEGEEHGNSGNAIRNHSVSLNGALPSEDSPDIDERERLRREKIGLANKGKTPWNKGKSHSPETIARLRERNKIVMQDPKIREKLRQHSHPQSQETREKIRIFMKSRMEFERRQLTIVQDWKDSIASMARRGVIGEDELQWNSFQALKKDMHRQYYAAKNKKRNRPKSLQFEHRLRISESVRAKWADPEFRKRVVERIQETRKKGPRTFKGRISDTEFDRVLNSLLSVSTGFPYRSLVSRDLKVGSYNDPLSAEKLKKIKMLRERNVERKEAELETDMVGSQFLDSKGGAFTDFLEEVKGKPMDVESQDAIHGGTTLDSVQGADMAALQHAQREATERARMLLAEAERAAVLAVQALDAAGAHDESLSDSLLEAWTLLDEANKSILNTEVTTVSTK